MLTRITGKLVHADGVPAFGTVVISWPAFTIYGIPISSGMRYIDVEDGNLEIDLYPTGASIPPGVYYTARFELDSNAVYEEYWVVPDTTAVTLEQIRVAFPVAPSIYISPTQITGAGAIPGQILSWNGANWTAGWVQITNVDPNYIRFDVGTLGTDFNINGSPAMLGTTATFNLPDASPTARGVVTTEDQTFGGDKGFTGSVSVGGSITGPTITDIYQKIATAGKVISVFGRDGYVVAMPGDYTVSQITGAVAQTRQIIAGTGLTGTGALSADVTLSVVPDTTVQRLRVTSGTAPEVLVRPEIHFTSGGTVLVTVSDDLANNRVNVLVSDTAALADPMISTGDLIVRSTTGTTRMGVGTNGQVLMAQSASVYGMYWATLDYVPSARRIITGQGLKGGGALTTDLTLTADMISVFGRTGIVQLTAADITQAGGVLQTRSVMAGSGLSGGGQLTSDVTLSLVDRGSIQKIQVGFDGTMYSTGSKLNFKPGAGVIITVQPAADQSDVTVDVNHPAPPIPTAKYYVNNALVATQEGLNLVAGANTTITGLNNAGGKRVDVTVTATGGTITPGAGQSPWMSDINADGFSLLNAKKIDAANSAVSFMPDDAGIVIHEYGRAGFTDWDMNLGPRLGFRWGPDQGVQLVMMGDGALACMGYAPTIDTENEFQQYMAWFYCDAFHAYGQNSNSTIEGHLTVEKDLEVAGLLDANRLRVFQPWLSGLESWLAPVIIEGSMGDMTGDMIYSPRIAFRWTTDAQIGMDPLGTIRTFNWDGSTYAPFAAALIESTSGGVKFPDGSIQATAAGADSGLIMIPSVASAAALPPEGEPNQGCIVTSTSDLWLWGTPETAKFVVADMTGTHEGIPHGVPSEFGWQTHPFVVMGNNPAGSKAINHWFNVYTDTSGVLPPNTRVNIRRCQVWWLRASTGQWVLGVNEDAPEVESYDENYSGGPYALDQRLEPDGSVSVKPDIGHNAHGFTPFPRCPIDPNDVGGVVSLVEARLILDNAGGTDDRAASKYMVEAGADYYPDVTGPGIPNNPGIGGGKFKYVKNDWNCFSFTTLSEQQLRDNPPPINLSVSGSWVNASGIPGSGTGGSQTPWLTDIDANGHNLLNCPNVLTNGVLNMGQWTVYTDWIDPDNWAAPIQIRETMLSAGADLSSARSPRIGFNWAGVGGAQIGMDASGWVRTFTGNGSGYAPFIAQEIKSNSVGFRFPDGTLQTTAATGTGGSQTPWLTDIDASKKNLNNLQGINLIDPNAGTAVGSIWLSATLGGLMLTSTNQHITITPGTGKFVRIGANAPAYMLDVTGDVNITGTYRVNGTPISGGSQTPWLSNIDANGKLLNNVGAIGLLGTNVAGVDKYTAIVIDRLYGSIGDCADISWGVSGRLSMNAVAGGESGFIFYAQTGAGDGTNNEVMRVQGNGQVNIRAAVNGVAPMLTLVNAGASTDGVSARLRFGSHSGFVANPQLGPYIEAVNMGGGGYSALAFGTYGAGGILERVRIDTDGKVGIGMTNPAHALDVYGNIRAYSSTVYAVNFEAAGQFIGNVTGSAGSVPWAGVSGKPNLVTQGAYNNGMYSVAGTYGTSSSNGAFEIREGGHYNNASNVTGSTDTNWAPRLGFHWAWVINASIYLDPAGFHFVNGNQSNYQTIRVLNLVANDTVYIGGSREKSSAVDPEYVVTMGSDRYLYYQHRLNFSTWVTPTWANVQGHPTDLASFTNSPGYMQSTGAVNQNIMNPAGGTIGIAVGTQVAGGTYGALYWVSGNASLNLYHSSKGHVITIMSDGNIYIPALTGTPGTVGGGRLYRATSTAVTQLMIS